MEVSLTVRQEKDVSVVDVTGSIRSTNEGNILRQQVSELVEQGVRKVLLNLQGLDCIYDNGCLIDSFNSVTHQGGQFKLCQLQLRIKRMLELVHLYTIFDIRDTEAEALADF
jgi:anti-sigma B factor antagonist